MNQIYEIETIISEKGKIQLPEELWHLKNHKVKLALIDEHETNHQNWLDLIESHAIDDNQVPADYSINIDHYLYGLPKRKIDEE